MIDLAHLRHKRPIYVQRDLYMYKVSAKEPHLSAKKPIIKPPAHYKLGLFTPRETYICTKSPMYMYICSYIYGNSFYIRKRALYTYLTVTDVFYVRHTRPVHIERDLYT